MARTSGGALPRLQNPANITDWASQFVAAVEQRLNALERAYQTGYQVTNNATPARALDVTGATLAQSKVVLGTLIQDLQQAGRLGD